MATAPAYTEADALVIRKAILTGAKRVRFSDGREEEFRSLAELWAILDNINAYLSGGDGQPPSRVSLAKFTRG